MSRRRCAGLASSRRRSRSFGIQGPTGAAFGRVRTGRRDQQGFLFARKLTGRAGPRLFAQRRLQIAEHEAALGPINHSDAPCDLLVAGAGVRSQQNLRALELARRVLAAAQKRFGWPA